MKYMIGHFENIQYLYGSDAYVQLPNKVFRDLSTSIKNKNGSTNIQQSSFAYAYLVCVAFLYKYARFIDVDNETYLQNTDIKQILGYSKTTKSIDHIIKKDGILEKIGLVETTKSYPVSAEYGEDEYNKFKIREFVTVDTIDDSFYLYDIIKNVVKNRNYEIREPRFMFEYDGDVGTLYNYHNTHRVTIKEFIKLVYDDSLDNIHFMLYFFFKSRCYKLYNNTKAIPLLRIINDIGIGKDSFYSHLKTMKKRNMISVNHKQWVNEGEGESNEYCFIGI